MDAVNKQALEAMAARILERFEETETPPLSAFHGRSSTMDLRMKSLSATN